MSIVFCKFIKLVCAQSLFRIQNRKVMTTSRAGGLHKPPWGISHAEPIGSSNDPPLAEVAPLPQMWQLSFSLPCVKGGGTACRDGGIVFSDFSRVQPLSQLR